jgi:hypothetical protein
MAATLLEQLTGEQLGALTEALGTDSRQTQAAIAAALPMLLKGLARNASAGDGASSLGRALARDHDGSLLDDLGGFLRQPDLAEGDGILRHVLGDRQKAIEAGVSTSSGLNIAKVGPLLATLAPILLGALGRRQRSESLDDRGLADLLGLESQAVEAAAPELGGLTQLLDRDGDGSVSDDVATMGADLLGKLLGRRS